MNLSFAVKRSGTVWDLPVQWDYPWALYVTQCADKQRAPAKTQWERELEMDKIQELIGVLSDDRVRNRKQISKSNHTCIICEQPAEKFLSASSEFEFKVSQICEDCQNYYYGVEH
ncbi:MAG: hypothetical protein PVJ19_22965 [Desulfobacteraceae bacterium]